MEIPNNRLLEGPGRSDRGEKPGSISRLPAGSPRTRECAGCTAPRGRSNASPRLRCRAAGRSPALAPRTHAACSPPRHYCAPRGQEEGEVWAHIPEKKTEPAGVTKTGRGHGGGTARDRQRDSDVMEGTAGLHGGRRNEMTIGSKIQGTKTSNSDRRNRGP
jgi:hypothetical protein